MLRVDSTITFNGSHNHNKAPLDGTTNSVETSILSLIAACSHFEFTPTGYDQPLPIVTLLHYARRYRTGIDKPCRHC